MEYIRRRDDTSWAEDGVITWREVCDGGKDHVCG